MHSFGASADVTDQQLTVEAIVEGEKERVDRVISWCRVGPIRERVESVDVRWEEFKDEFDDFTALTRHNSY